jgi:lipopolysaccharide heptosyltransferase II
VRKFLIIQTASIGDVILTTPIVEKLHRFYPDAQIDLLLKKGTQGLFKQHPFLHAILIWDKSQHKYRNLLDLLNHIQHTKYDVVINVQRFASSGFLTAFSKAKKSIGFNKNPFSLFFSKRIKHKIGKNSEQLHEIDRNLKLIEHLTDDSPSPIKLYPTPEDFAKVSQYKTKQYICLAPASLWFTKQYPAEQWFDFLNKIDKDLYVYLMGGKEDFNVCKNIIEQSNHQNCLNLAGKMSFLQTAALMRDARRNFVNDSASAMNAPQTVLFCSTVPEFGFGPLSDDSILIQTNKILSCKPCGLHGFKACPKEHFDCAKTIKTEQLLESLK